MVVTVNKLPGASALDALRTTIAPTLLRMGTLALVLTSTAAVAQLTARDQADPELPNILRENPNVPESASHLRGLNAGVTSTGAHDSAAGYSGLMIPMVSYSFLRRYSADITFPIYMYHLAETGTTTQLPPAAPGEPPTQEPSRSALAGHNFDPGDTYVAVHGTFGNGRFLDVLTPAMTLPSGDTADGLSTGRVTFDLDSRTEMRAFRSALILDLGGGDSSSLVNRPITGDYTSLGALAHFQLGLRIPLALRSSFQSVAYEQLPLGDNKLYTTLTRPGYPNRTVVSGRSVSEDNGFINTLYLPLTRHVALEGYYERSLRLHLDSVGLSVTFVTHRANLGR